MDIKALAAAYPGQLFMQGVAEVDRVLGSREGAIGSSSGALMAPRFVPYLLTCFHGRFPVDRTGVGKARELRTLATALDPLGRGEIAQASDLLVQRFKAVTAAIEDGNWTLAQRYELISDTGGGLIGVHERKLADKDEALAARPGSTAGKRGVMPARPE